jgi:hypothetical protein
MPEQPAAFPQFGHQDLVGILEEHLADIREIAAESAIAADRVDHG